MSCPAHVRTILRRESLVPNIDRRVDVPVMMGTTLRADPFPDGQVLRARPVTVTKFSKCTVLPIHEGHRSFNPMLIKSCTQPHPCHTQGWGFLFFFRQYIHADVLFSIVSELRPLPVLATVLVSHGNIPKNAHGLAIPVRRRPWPRDKPLLFFGALAMHVFRAVQIVQQ